MKYLVCNAVVREMTAVSTLEVSSCRSTAGSGHNPAVRAGIPRSRPPRGKLRLNPSSGTEGCMQVLPPHRSCARTLLCCGPLLQAATGRA